MCIDTLIPRRPPGEARAETSRYARRAARVVAAALLALSFVVAAQPAQPARIGYVDMQRLIDGSPQFIAGREALQREFTQRDAALKVDEARLSQLESALKRDGATLPPATADARQHEIDALRRSIERTRAKLRDDLNKRREEMLDARWSEINDVVIAYAREHRIDLVVQSPVIYASASIDITDAVLERLKAAPADAAASR